MKTYWIGVATSPENCGDTRDIITVAVGSHRARLNTEPAVTISEVVARLRQIMSYRVDKVVFVDAQPDVPWGEFLELVSQVRPEVDFCGIVTPQVWESARRNGCLNWSSADRSKVRGGSGRR